MDAAALLRSRWRTASQILAQWRALVLSLAVLLLFTAAVSGAYQRYLGWSQHRRLETAQATVQDVAAKLGAHLQELWSFTPSLSESTQVVNLLRTGNPKAIAAWEALISEQYPQVRLARLLLLGARRVDYSSNPPLSYAALDMVPQADLSGPAPTPTLLLGGADQHIAIVLPIVGQSGKRLGHLFLALDGSLLQNTLTDFAFPAGYWEVRQPVGEGGFRILHTVGTQASRGAEPLIQAKIPATGWLIAFWDPSLAGKGTVFTPTAYIWAAAGSIALLLVLYFVARKRRKASTVRSEKEERHRSRQPEGEQKDELATVLALPPLTSSAGAVKPPTLEVLESATAAGTQAPGIEVSKAESRTTSGAVTLPSVIFRAYDVRGIVDEALTADIVMALGRAIGSEARAQEQAPQTVVVGHDARLSSASLSEALITGLLATGCDVVNIGQVPTPIVYFATHYLQTGNGVIVTGSHNPPEYNGLKIMLGGQVLAGDQITRLRDRIEAGELTEGVGNLQAMEVVDEYVRGIADDIPVTLGNAFQIVVDCGNGVAGEIAPKLYRALGHDVIELHCEVEGHFPHHHPDPSQPQNLKELIETVLETGADLGLAFDGDGDRLGVVDSKGAIIWPDQQMMLFAKDILSHNPGATVVYDVKCSNHLKQVIEQFGGQPIMWKSGHSFIRKKMQESGAPFAGELTGHIFFSDRWYGFDDAFYAGARLLELLMASSEAPHKVFSKLPGAYSTPELRIDLAGEEHMEFMTRLLAVDAFLDAQVERLDGLRVNYPDGWGLVRASNTTPSLVLRFEGDTKDALERIQGTFKELLLKIEPNLAIPF
jgi:phosphomannomutase/phosphoglucomutase